MEPYIPTDALRGRFAAGKIDITPYFSPNTRYSGQNNYEQSYQAGNIPEIAKYSKDRPKSAEIIGEMSSDPIEAFSSLKMESQYLSTELLEKLITERLAMTEKASAAIAGRISDLTSEISTLSQLYYGQATSREQSELQRAKGDLERCLIDLEISTWRDTTQMQERLLETRMKSQRTKLQTDLLSSFNN